MTATEKKINQKTADRFFQMTLDRLLYFHKKGWLTLTGFLLIYLHFKTNSALLVNLSAKKIMSELHIDRASVYRAIKCLTEDYKIRIENGLVIGKLEMRSQAQKELDALDLFPAPPTSWSELFEAMTPEEQEIELAKR